MNALETQLGALREAAQNPQGVLDAHLEAGKRVIGVGPYYVPEELVYAAGAEPFGVWGCVGTAEAARKYFPPFYCSICQMTLEMGMNGTLDKLSALMTTGLCDTLRAASQNYKVGMSIPQIFVSQPQNRTCEAGRTYAIESYKDVKRKVEEAAGDVITDEALAAANKLFNEWRAAMREFVELAGTHPAQISVADRAAVIDSGYYLDKADHLERVREINASLAALPASTDGYTKIVVSGVYQDIPALEEILDENKYAIVADDVAKESRAFARVVPEEGDPLEALAMSYVNLKNDPILFDPEKGRVEKVVSLAQSTGAQGVVLFLAKFCDPEEFAAPLVMTTCREAGIPIVQVEIDQSTESYEQARTQLEAFKELTL